jgi:hypothetical protein
MMIPASYQIKQIKQGKCKEEQILPAERLCVRSEMSP